MDIWIAEGIFFRKIPGGYLHMIPDTEDSRLSEKCKNSSDIAYADSKLILEYTGQHPLTSQKLFRMLKLFLRGPNSESGVLFVPTAGVTTASFGLAVVTRKRFNE